MNERFFANFVICLVCIASFGVAIFEQPLQEWRSYRPPDPLVDDYASIHSLDFYPFSSYPMFCWDFHRPTIFELELVISGREGLGESLDISQSAPPYWEKGLRESLHSHLKRGGDTESFFRPLAREPESNSLRVFVNKWQWEEWLAFKRSGAHHHSESRFEPYAHDLLTTIAP